MKSTHVYLYVAGLMLSIAGCGSKSTIAGTVTYQGRPIPAGTILFVPDSGAHPVSAPIHDGEYTAENVPAGPAKILVSSFHREEEQRFLMANAMSYMLPPPEAPIPAEARRVFERNSQNKKGLRIPPRYANLEQSGLSFTVTSGRQTKDFQLP